MLRKREVVHMHGFPVGTAEVIISDGGMIFVSNFEATTNQANLGLITDEMDFGNGVKAQRESDGSAQ